jgi:hypothetical protein
VAGVDGQMTETSSFVAERIAFRLLERDETEASLRRAVERLVEEHGDRTIGEWLESIGAPAHPGVETWAELSWPVVAKMLDSEPVRELLEKLSADFYASLA